jgi:hypothetical protein
LNQLNTNDKALNEKQQTKFNQNSNYFTPSSLFPTTTPLQHSYSIEYAPIGVTTVTLPIYNSLNIENQNLRGFLSLPSNYATQLLTSTLLINKGNADMKMIIATLKKLTTWQNLNSESSRSSSSSLQPGQMGSKSGVLMLNSPQQGYTDDDSTMFEKFSTNALLGASDLAKALIAVKIDEQPTIDEDIDEKDERIEKKDTKNILKLKKSQKIDDENDDSDDLGEFVYDGDDQYGLHDLESSSDLHLDENQQIDTKRQSPRQSSFLSGSRLFNSGSLFGSKSNTEDDESFDFESQKRPNFDQMDHDNDTNDQDNDDFITTDQNFTNLSILDDESTKLNQNQSRISSLSNRPNQCGVQLQHQASNLKKNLPKHNQTPLKPIKDDEFDGLEGFEQRLENNNNKLNPNSHKILAENNKNGRNSSKWLSNQHADPNTGLSPETPRAVGQSNQKVTSKMLQIDTNTNIDQNANNQQQPIPLPTPSLQGQSDSANSQRNSQSSQNQIQNQLELQQIDQEHHELPPFPSFSPSFVSPPLYNHFQDTKLAEIKSKTPGVVFAYGCVLITPIHKYAGILMLCDDLVTFEGKYIPDCNSGNLMNMTKVYSHYSSHPLNKNPYFLNDQYLNESLSVSFRVADVNNVIPKQFMTRCNALEISLVNSQSYFFHFSHPDHSAISKQLQSYRFLSRHTGLQTTHSINSMDFLGDYGNFVQIDENCDHLNKSNVYQQLIPMQQPMNVNGTDDSGNFEHLIHRINQLGSTDDKHHQHDDKSSTSPLNINNLNVKIQKMTPTLVKTSAHDSHPTTADEIIMKYLICHTPVATAIPTLRDLSLYQSIYYSRFTQYQQQLNEGNLNHFAISGASAAGNLLNLHGFLVDFIVLFIFVRHKWLYLFDKLGKALD